MDCGSVQCTVESTGEIRILPIDRTGIGVVVIECPIRVNIISPVVWSIHSCNLHRSFIEQLRDPPIGAIIGTTVNTSGRISSDSILKCGKSIGSIAPSSGRNRLSIDLIFKREINLVIHSMLTCRTARYLSQRKNGKSAEVELVRSIAVVQCHIGHAVIDSIVREGLVEANSIYTLNPGIVLVNENVSGSQVIVLKPEELGDCSVCGIVRCVGCGESKGAVYGFVGKKVEVRQHIDECEISVGSLT